MFFKNIFCSFNFFVRIGKKMFLSMKMFRNSKYVRTFSKYRPFSEFLNKFQVREHFFGMFQKLFAFFKKGSFFKFCLVCFSFKKDHIFKKLFIILKKCPVFKKHKLKNVPVLRICSQIKKCSSFGKVFTN